MTQFAKPLLSLLVGAQANVKISTTSRPPFCALSNCPAQEMQEMQLTRILGRTSP
jgi:hypothetical protein